MADNPNVRDNPVNSNPTLDRLSNELRDLTIQLAQSKKSIISTTKNSRKAGLGVFGIGSRALLNGLAIKSPILYMAKGIYEDVQHSIKERKALEKRIIAKQKRVDEEIQKQIIREKKKESREAEATKKAEERAKKQESNTSSDATKPQATLVKTKEGKQTATAVSRDDDIFFKRYPELAGAFDQDEEKKQTAVLKEIAKGQKQSAKKVHINDKEREQRQKRSEFLSTKASNQKRGADGRFIKTSKMESLLEKMVKMMTISNALSAIKSVGGGLFGGVLGGIFGALGTIFNPKNLIGALSAGSILKGLGSAFGGLFKIFTRLAGTLVRVSAIGFAVVATVIGILNGIDAFINTKGPLSKKLGAAFKGFLMGVGDTFVASMEMLFGKEKTWEVLNAYGKGVDKMIDKIKKSWNDPNSSAWSFTKDVASAIGTFVNDMFGGAFTAIGNALADWEVTVPFTNKKIKPFSFMASEPSSADTSNKTATPITPTAIQAISTEGVVLPNQSFTTTAPSRVSYESAEALQRAREFNENSKIVAQGVPGSVNSTAPIMPIVTNVSNNINQGTVVGITSNIRDPDTTISRMLK